MKILYTPRTFRNRQRGQIQWATDICEEYARQGYDLTLRQLYYQFVSRGFIPNNDKEYNKLGDLISNARRAGLIDWNHILDRTRNVRGYASWESPSDIIDSAARSFSYDLWSRTNQQHRPQVWVEKDALVSVVARACAEYRVPHLSCRGYPSDSVLHQQALTFAGMSRRGLTPVIIHLGDHDPSGIDMTRDIEERLSLFGAPVHVERVALTMDQIDEYTPPPNPAKISDSRYEKYLEEYGDQSWELDALEPSVLDGIIRTAIAPYVDEDDWDLGLSEEQRACDRLTEIGARWDDIDDRWNDIEGLLDGRESLA